MSILYSILPPSLGHNWQYFWFFRATFITDWCFLVFLYFGLVLQGFAPLKHFPVIFMEQLQALEEHDMFSQPRASQSYQTGDQGLNIVIPRRLERVFKTRKRKSGLGQRIGAQSRSPRQLKSFARPNMALPEGAPGRAGRKKNEVAFHSSSRPTRREKRTLWKKAGPIGRCGAQPGACF